MSFYAKLTSFLFLILSVLSFVKIRYLMTFSINDYEIYDEIFYGIGIGSFLLFLFGMGLSWNYNKLKMELLFLISKLKVRTSTAKWNKVKIIAQEQTQFGVVSDKEGELVVVSRRKGEDWPHNTKPFGGINEINKGFTSYIIMDE